ncbi:hypothetical protein P7L54_07795 [Acinetobacter bereziniae]|uniref:hypothetical protein n=1 Tax=Acinetobacter bereziniae TaxID=106648 RepID=UPI0019074E65|nr:hypothetical protein [Acinetobacter bereziniae]MDG3555854.1 hypothetical protein [Acinetobacter bereziniae]MDP5999805.1 hypothetical protein [Acinetobacter bereziniae]QQC81239.1 hypothetical protein I9192_03790 [Acinetobacter bereziniae]UUN94344.1 hypothetical protein I9189_003790 [Acinetobacter bereziniae]WMW75409.1 hypothetical protein RG306_03785 [Acinetobacter bereziniae]
MKRPVMSFGFQEKSPLSYPEYEIWSVKQKQVYYLITHMKGYDHLPIATLHHIAFHYGDFMDIDKFAEFFINFWNTVGRYLELDIFDSVDEMFIDWVKIMRYERFCNEMSMCHSTYEKFLFQPE